MIKMLAKKIDIRSMKWSQPLVRQHLLLYRFCPKVGNVSPAPNFYSMKLLKLNQGIP